MSCSSLYVIDKNYYGSNIADFKNSWLFSPIIWNVLSEKYLPTKYGLVQSVIGLDGNEVWIKINRTMNNSGNTCERICWELTNQCIFFSKDKKCIAQNIFDFINTHKGYSKSKEDGISALEREHIIERFTEIANSIMDIDETEYPYFVLKNSSCDDEVERWFKKYDDEADEYQSRSLKDFPEFVTEFVVIENNKIKEFIVNVEYPYEDVMEDANGRKNN